MLLLNSQFNNLTHTPSPLSSILSPLFSLLYSLSSSQLQDHPGALYDVLRYFWKFDVSITRIESRPAKMNSLGEERFDFFVDFIGSRGDSNVEKLISKLEEFTTRVMVLSAKEVSFSFSFIPSFRLSARRSPLALWQKSARRRRLRLTHS